MNRYAIVIEKGESNYSAYVPDLPGCVTSAESPEQVEQQLHEAVDLYLSYYHQRGLTPQPPQARVGTLSAA